MRARTPTTPVICSTCGRELRGSECADGFRVRRHQDSVSEKGCQGAYRVDHQPVVVRRWEANREKPSGLVAFPKRAAACVTVLALLTFGGFSLLHRVHIVEPHVVSVNGQPVRP